MSKKFGRMQKRKAELLTPERITPNGQRARDQLREHYAKEGLPIEEIALAVNPGKNSWSFKRLDDDAPDPEGWYCCLNVRVPETVT